MDEMEVAGLRIAFQRAGEGPLLVLLHGIQRSSSCCVRSFQIFLSFSSPSALIRSDLFGSRNGMMKYSMTEPSSRFSVNFVFLSASLSVSGFRYLHITNYPRESSALTSSFPDFPFVRT